VTKPIWCAYCKNLHEVGEHTRAMPVSPEVENKSLRKLLTEKEAELKRLHTWEGLLSLLDKHWPEDIFPTLPDGAERDPGPRLVSALRWIAKLLGENERLRIKLGPDEMLEADGVGQAMETITVVSNMQAQLARGERVVLTSPDGASLTILPDGDEGG